eukprot:EG_transcript_9945
MFGRASEQQTLAALRALHASGALSGAELDDQIAADLLGGSPQSRKESVGVEVPAKKRETPRRLEPLTKAPGLEGALHAATRLDDAQLREPLTEQVLRQLASECENFSNKMQENTALAKELMHKALLDLFVQDAQDKLPDCFLRSLPKFGKGANQMVTLFSRSLNKKKTDSVVDRKEGAFELVIQDEVVDEIGRDIEQVIDEEMKRYFGVITSDMQKILKSVTRLRGRLEVLEGELLQERREARALRERLAEAEAAGAELQAQCEQLQQQGQEKETQMDVLSEQVKRRNQMLDEQRARFHKEVMRYKTRIYELTVKLESGDLGRRHSFTETGSGEMAAPHSAPDGYEVMEAVDSATREIRDQMLESIRKMKAEHAKEKKELMQQKKVAIDERDNEIYHLKMNLKSMDRIIEVEKRRLMKNRELELKEIQEKYEQKVHALQAELEALRGSK